MHIFASLLVIPSNPLYLMAFLEHVIVCVYCVAAFIHECKTYCKARLSNTMWHFLHIYWYQMICRVYSTWEMPAQRWAMMVMPLVKALKAKFHPIHEHVRHFSSPLISEWICKSSKTNGSFCSPSPYQRPNVHIKGRFAGCISVMEFCP